MKIFSVANNDMTLIDFVVGKFRYARRGVNTDAIQVTPENIGMLAIEFEAELFYSVSGDPYFSFYAERLEQGLKVPDQAELVRKQPRELILRPSDWLFPLRGEFHMFRDWQFIHAFEAVGPVTHHPMRDHWNPDSSDDLDYKVDDDIMWMDEFGKEHTGRILQVYPIKFGQAPEYRVLDKATGDEWGVLHRTIKGVVNEDKSSRTLQPIVDNLLVEIVDGQYKGKIGVVNKFDNHNRGYEIQLDDESGGQLVMIPEDMVQQYP